MELVIRPKTHTKKGLSKQEVLDIVIKRSTEVSKQKPIKVQFIVYTSTNVDDPIDFREAGNVDINIPL